MKKMICGAGMSNNSVMAICNTVRLSCFIVLAIMFDKWWIVFLAPLFFLTKEEPHARD